VTTIEYEKKIENENETPKNLLDLIAEKQAVFSKGHSRIASFLVEHYDKAAYLTASKLAGIIGLSESTVVRFACELGFSGYPQLKIALEELVKTKLTATQRVEVSQHRFFYNDKSVLKSVLQNDADRIAATFEGIDQNTFDAVVNEIIKAEKIYIIGGRSASPLASFFSFYLNLMVENVVNTSANPGSEVFEQIFRIGQGDLCIGLSFPRYSQKTVEAMAYAKGRDAVTVAVTDSISSPIASIARHNLIAASDMLSFIDSLVAPMSVINAILVAVSLKKQDELVHTLDKLENIWKEFKVYSPNEE
jgi:DNA-binding MurR/RpiR family transcriptional regulator